MPWLDRPASMYVRFEVVLHRIDDPMLLQVQDRTTGRLDTFEIMEARFGYVWDVARARWDVQAVRPFGYRRGSRNSISLEVQATSPELRDLAAKYAPDWVPDPAKPRLHLPAEAVWDEAMDHLASAPVGPDVQHAAKVMKTKNPYRGE